MWTNFSTCSGTYIPVVPAAVHKVQFPRLSPNAPSLVFVWCGSATTAHDFHSASSSLRRLRRKRKRKHQRVTFLVKSEDPAPMSAKQERKGKQKKTNGTEAKSRSHDQKKETLRKREALSAAQKVDNVFSLLPGFQIYARNGVDLRLEQTSAEALLDGLGPGKPPSEDGGTECVGAPPTSSALAEQQSEVGMTDQLLENAENAAGTANAPCSAVAEQQPSGLETLRQLFTLTRNNMRSLYDSTNFNETGWNDRQKWKELTGTETKFIVAYRSETGQENGDADGSINGNVKSSTANKGHRKVVGFVHFRFETDSDNSIAGRKDDPVIYIWDMQLEKVVQRKGLGKHFVNILDLAGRLLHMQKLMCTVLKQNTDSVRFYREKCKFLTDESSPDNFAEIDDEELCEYDILKKDLPAVSVKASSQSIKPAVLPQAATEV